MTNDTPADQRYRPADRIMQGVIPYLSLAGRTAEAADFYIRAFAAKDIGRMANPDRPDQIMHLQLDINGGALMLTDETQTPDDPYAPPLQRGHLQLVVPNGAEWFARALDAGCELVVPYARQPWGDDWGMVRDPYGLLWAVLTPDPALWDKGE